MRVVIAEKPSVAKEIAKILHVTNYEKGHFRNDLWAVTWAFGHLVENSYPAAYGWVEWNADSLPMIPEQFKLQPKQIMDSKKKTLIDDPGALAQLKIINSLFNEASEIIVATDAGREGELIFRLIYTFLKCNKPFRRLWVSSLTTSAIQEGFRNLKSGNHYDNLYQSAKCRSEADWLVGMNASRALTIGSNFVGRFSLGRVQTPTLAIICERYKENKEFVPEPYFVLQISCEKDGIIFKADSQHIKEKERCLALLKAIELVSSAEVKNMERKEVKENPHLLYDLTSLQRDANKRYGFSADKTLRLAQTLYEKKYITYPRTGSRYISEDVFETIPRLLSVIKDNNSLLGSYAGKLIRTTFNRRCVNDSKVTDHHALLITGIYPDHLNNEESIIFEMILLRMLESFSPACFKDKTNVVLCCADESFKATGSTIQQGNAGWREVRMIASVKEEEDDNKEENIEQIFPNLIIGTSIKKIGSEVLSKKTKPKPVHTESSLLGFMETCGKTLEDDEAKDAMKDLGIGTPATRAGIIETLIKRGYIERQKKQLVPTNKGMGVYMLLKDRPIASVELTGKWEAKLEQISRGEQAPGPFMKHIEVYAERIVKDLLIVGARLKDLNLTSGDQVSCPICKTGHLLKGEKNFYCSNYPKKLDDGSIGEGCRFVIWRTISEKKLTDNHIYLLATKGETNLIKGFKSKSGKEFDAYLVLNEDGAIKFSFDRPDKPSGNKQSIKSKSGGRKPSFRQKNKSIQRKR